MKEFIFNKFNKYIDYVQNKYNPRMLNGLVSIFDYNEHQVVRISEEDVAVPLMGKQRAKSIPVHIYYDEDTNKFHLHDGAIRYLNTEEVEEELESDYIDHLIGNGDYALHHGDTLLFYETELQYKTMADYLKYEAWENDGLILPGTEEYEYDDDDDQHHSRELQQEYAEGECNPNVYSETFIDTQNTGTDMKWIVYRITFDDHTQTPYDKEGYVHEDDDYQSMILKAKEVIEGQAHDFYKFGQSVITPNIRISSKTWEDWKDHQPWTAVLAEARQKLKEDLGLNFCDFAFEILLTAYDDAVPYGGLAYTGYKAATINGGMSAATYIHEFGHTLGLRHAKFWSFLDRSKATSPYSDGFMYDFSDPFDAMGSAHYWWESKFSAAVRNRIGWNDFLVHENQIGHTNEDMILYPSDMGFTDKLVLLTYKRIVKKAKMNHINSPFTTHYFEYYANYSNSEVKNSLIHRVFLPAHDNFVVVDHHYTTASKMDAGIPIGESENDCKYGFHITPVRKIPCPDATNIDCLQVAVRHGTYENPFDVSFVPAVMDDIKVNQEFTIEANLTLNDAISPLTVNWFIDDGTAEGHHVFDKRTLTYSYALSGVHVIKVIVTDHAGGYKEYNYVVNVDGKHDTTGKDLLSKATDVMSTDDILEFSYNSLPKHSLENGFSFVFDIEFNENQAPRYLISRKGESDVKSFGLIVHYANDFDNSFHLLYETTKGKRGIDIHPEIRGLATPDRAIVTLAVSSESIKVLILMQIWLLK